MKCARGILNIVEIRWLEVMLEAVPQLIIQIMIYEVFHYSFLFFEMKFFIIGKEYPITYKSCKYIVHRSAQCLACFTVVYPGI